MIAKVVSIQLLDLTDDERQRLLNGAAMFVYKDGDGKYKPYAPIEAAQMPFGIALGDAAKNEEVTIAVQGAIHANAPGSPYYCKPGDPPAEPKVE